MNSTDGKNVFAAILAVVFFALPILTLATNLSGAVGEPLWPFQLAILILLVSAGWGGIRLGKRGWPLASGLLWGLGSASFGYAMEGWTGMFVGLFLGLLGGGVAGCYIPWLLRILPEHWGLRTGWALVAVVAFLVPLLVILTLLFGSLDDDDSAFVIVAAFLALRYASSRGWFTRDHFHCESVLAEFSRIGRRWLDPRIVPFLFALFASGLIAGPIGARYHIESGESLTITLDPLSWLWPVSICAAAIYGISVALKKRSALNGAYLVAASLLLVNFLLVLLIFARFKAEITPDALHVRLGLFKNVDISREDLVSIHIETARGRRYAIPYPVLVTRDGQSHHLHGTPYGTEITGYLAEKWGITVY